VHLLTFLVENAGHKVSREEICNHLWPNLSLCPDRLKVLVSNVRSVLGDSRAGTRKFIATVEDGYCFVHPLSRVTRPGYLSCP
jgi:DNA-binding winged helix-turn-helix (wHTH) protein